jgi:predicted transcriptional regulator
LIYNLGRVLTKPMTVNELADKLNIDNLNKPALRAALNSAVKAGLASKTKRRLSDKLIWVYKWRC